MIKRFIQDKKVFIKIKNLKLDHHYLMCRFLQEEQVIVDKYKGLGKLVLAQRKSNTNKYAFMLDSYYFKRFGDKYEFLGELVDFQILDEKRYLKRIEWSQKHFVFVLGCRSALNMSKYSKAEITIYEKKMAQNASEATKTPS